MKPCVYLAVAALFVVSLADGLFAEDAADDAWGDAAAPAPAPAEAAPAAAAPAEAAPAPAAPAVSADPLPVEVHCGSILEVQRKSAAIPWRDMDKVLALKHLAVPEDEPEEDTIISREPGAGKAYVVVSVLVKPKRSVGRYDYVISHSEGESPCIAMAWAGGPFDQRNWQGVPKGVPTQVELLYEVPEDQGAGKLTFKLPVSLPMQPVAIAFPNPDAPAPAPAPAEVNDAPAPEEKKQPEEKKTEEAKKPAEAEAKKAPEKKQPEAKKKAPEGSKKAEGGDKKPAEKPKAAPKPKKPAPADDWF